MMIYFELMIYKFKKKSISRKVFS